MAYRHVALQLAATIRHDGHGGVTDDLETVEGLALWLEQNADLLADNVIAAESVRERVVEVRRAVRALFARAARPAELKKGDTDSRFDPRVALEQVNAAAGAVSWTYQLDWPDGGDPAIRSMTSGIDPETRLIAALARAAIDFLASDARERLRACPAPRCVRYFVKEHPQQEWCGPSCGNRARVSRYYQRKHQD
jgi:predicted RNA-binding Zn ribbon-like protein